MARIKIDREVEDRADAEDYLKYIASQVACGYQIGEGWEYDGDDEGESENVGEITCECTDGSCSGSTGPEGEVAGHIEICDCSQCHHEMGKV